MKLVSARPRASETPTLARSFLLPLVLCLLSVPVLPSVASAQAPRQGAAPLSEADVIRLAREHSPASTLADATDELAKAHRRTEGVFRNPSVGWSRETVQTGPVAGQGSQDILTATVPIDLARPLAARSLVASQSAWMHAEASLVRTDAVLEAVLAYHDVVLAQARTEVLAQSVADLEEAERVLDRREAAGSASGYESTRLALASELGRSHLAQAHGDLDAAKARLAGLLDVPVQSLSVTGDLTLISAAQEATLAAGAGERHEALKRARKSQRLADKARNRAAWTWLPTLEFGAGLKRANNFGMANGYGYAIGAALDIPLFDRGQAERARAKAQHELARARTHALTRTIDTDVQAALAEFRAARRELERFETQTKGQVEALLVAVRSGYREGERSVVELLDAQRARTDVAQRRLSLLGAAKRAEARLRAAAGDLQ